MTWQYPKRQIRRFDIKSNSKYILSKSLATTANPLSSISHLPTTSFNLSILQPTANQIINIQQFNFIMSDLNSVPPSSRIQPISSQESAQLARLQHITPSDSNLHILPSNQHEMNHSRTSSTPASAQVQGVQRDHSPGPLRHPKPITVSQLHMELEREQEQVVRLTYLNTVCQKNPTFAGQSAVTRASYAARCSKRICRIYNLRLNPCLNSRSHS